MLFGAGLFGLGYGMSQLANWLARKRFSPANLYLLGCNYTTRKPKVGIEFLSSALSGDARLIGAYYNRALCHIGLADKEALDNLKKPHLVRAEEDLQSYLAARPDRAEAYYVLGMIQKSRGNSSEAQELLGRAAQCLENNPTPADAGIQPPSLNVIESSLATI
jgi:tetratricopeptide (TPR) repeat protein